MGILRQLRPEVNQGGRDSTTVFDESFENGVGATPVILTAYTGATGETYTADLGRRLWTE